MSDLYIMRHGQTTFNLEQRMGGDPELTAKGKEQARQVSKYVPKLDQLHHSTLQRSKQTAYIIDPTVPLLEDSRLNEISVGDLDGITYQEFEKDFPELFAARAEDKYNWAFPGGESYAEAITRVAPLIDSFDRESNVGLVGHQGIIRAIIGYLMEYSEEEIPYIIIPQDRLHIYEWNSGRIFQCSDETKEGIEFERPKSNQENNTSLETK